MPFKNRVEMRLTFTRIIFVSPHHNHANKLSCSRGKDLLCPIVFLRNTITLNTLYSGFCNPTRFFSSFDRRDKVFILVVSTTGLKP